MKLSHSKLNTILSCPMTYYLGYELGIKQKVEKPALMLGSAVHWGIEHDTTDLTEYFNTRGSFNTINNYTREQFLAEAMIYGYQKHKQELFEQLLTDPETGEKLELLDEMHEIYLTASLPSHKFTEAHSFVGIIDLLLLTNKGFIIVDYKTSTFVPNWDDYLDQLYRYVFELKSNFTDTNIVKIAIINLRKTGIRQKKTETEFEFLQRLKLEYELNTDDYINYHEFLPSDLDNTLLAHYIDNLSYMSDTAQTIVDNKLWYINYGNAKTQYGKSEYYDMFYHTPHCEVLYNIADTVYDCDTNEFMTFRECIELDMKVVDHKNVLNKYDIFEKALLATSCMSKEEFFTELSETYIVDKKLLDIYWLTYVKLKEVKNIARQQ